MFTLQTGPSSPPKHLLQPRCSFFFFRPTPLGFRQVVQHVTQTNTELANEGQEMRLGSFAARSSHLFQAIAGLSGATFATPGSRTKFKLLLLKSASNLLHFNKVATMGTLVSDRLPVVFCSRPQTGQKITARTKNLQKWKTNAMSSYLRVQRECRRYRNLRNLLGSAVQDVVLNSLRPSTQPSQLLPELSHFYQTHKHKE